MFDASTLLLLAAIAAPADSSAYAPTANDSVLASVVGPLIQPGNRLRVRTSSGVAEGSAGWVSPEGLRLHIDAQDIWSQPRTRALTWPEIQRIDQHTLHAGNAARIGATVGCLLGMAMVASAWAYASAYGSGPGPGGVLIAFATGGVAGGCAGGLAGGLLGSLFPAWKTIYERR